MAAAAASALPAFSAAGKAAAATGVGAGVWGKFAWGYSRSLYMFDAGFRFERMNAGYDFANAQQEMYRADLVMLTELTFRKMAVYTVIGTMGMAIYIAIFCAGRLGLHGPSPPVWIMGLFLTNIAAAFAYAGMGIWFAFHAMWRAKAACLHLNTRKVRLMIPSRKKLDDARKYGSQWEHQKVRDLLRVPYVCDAVGWKWSGEVPDVSDEEEDYDSTTGSGSGRASSSPPTNGRRKGQGKKRAPCWLTEEYEQERVGLDGGSGNTGQREDAPPEHFQLYAKAQKEWFTHDCYARVCMFYSFLCFFQGGSFYSLGQIAIELRAWWPMFAANFIFMVLHFLMLRFDIVKQSNTQTPAENEKLRNCQYAGTFTIPVAAIGMALDFRVEYWEATVHLTWMCIFICYLLQIVYAFRLYELAQPEEIRREERAGTNWWPVGWKVPASFQHVFYFVAPPPRLAVEKGQVDVVRQFKEGYYGKKAGGAKDGLGPPPAEQLVMGMEDHFQWMMHTAWANLSKTGKERVRTLYHRFTETTNRVAGNELANALGHIESELRAIEKEELSGDATKGDGYDSGSGSGSGSGSDGSSGYSSAGSGNGNGNGSYSKEYPAVETGRVHPDMPAFTKVQYVEPHKLVSIVAMTFAVSWIFLTFGMIIDRIVGVQGLVTAPHWAKPPMSRSSKYPWERGTPLGLQVYSGEKPWIPEELWWQENMKVRPKGWMPHWMGFGHGTRRLSATESHGPSTSHGFSKEAMKQAFHSLMTAMPKPEVAAELLQRVPTQEEALALTNLEQRFKHTGLGWRPQAHTWPGFFEPKLLACGLGKDGVRHALAISPRGVAAAAQLGGEGGEAERFMLTGLANYPPLLAATGAKDGLMLVSKMGDLLHCPGARKGKQWACGPLTNSPARVPLAEGSRLHAAASMWLGSASEPRLHVAVILESSPDVIALWALDGNTEAASWMPLGELPVPRNMARGASLAFVNDGDLLLATPDGATIQRRISDGTVVTSTAALNFDVEKQPTLQWTAACALHGAKGGIAHLSMRQNAARRHPEVMVLGTSVEVV